MVYHKMDLFQLKKFSWRLKKSELLSKTVTVHFPTETNFQKYQTQQVHIKLRVEVQPYVTVMLSFQSYQNLEYSDLLVSQMSEHCCQAWPLLGDLSITIFYIWQKANILEMPKAQCDVMDV